MITLTLEKPIKLSKYNFTDIEELFDEYRIISIKKGEFVEVGRLSEEELSEESIKNIELAKKLSNSAFTNI